jgi:tape measure domain-containing protein
MAEDGKIVYRVVIDDSGAIESVEQIGRRSGGALEEVMTGAARRIGEAFVNMAAKAGEAIVDIAKAGVEFNSKMEKYQTAFTTLLGNEEEAARVMAQIREDAARTPFDVDSLTQANQMLVAAGISADQARGDVLNLANAIAATGGGSAELSRMAANLQQIQNTGKASAMDIRQFANAGINIYGLLADSMGVTAAEAAEMDVTYEQLAAALAHAAEAGGKYEGALEAQSQTFQGRISTLKDNATQLAGALTEDLFAKLSDGALPMVMDWVATLLEAAQTGGIEGALSAAGDILGGIVQGITDNLPTVLPAAMDIITTLLEGLIRQIPNIVTAGINLLVALARGLIDALPHLVDMIPVIIGALIQTIIQNLPVIIAAGIELLLALGKGLLQAIPQLLLMLPRIIAEIVGAFTTVDWLGIGTNIVRGIWDGITGLWDGLVNAVREGVKNLWESAKRALGIASPSKKFKYIGEMTTEGTIEGIEDTQAEMTRTVTDVYGGMADSAQSALTRDLGSLEQNVSYNVTASGKLPDMTIVVPLTLDGREIARATAWSMGEQLAWEEL